MMTADERRLKVEEIKVIVSVFFNLSVKELETRDKRKTTTIARQIAIFLAKQKTEASLSEIGSYFGQHRTSVLQSITKIDEQRRTVPEVREAIDKLLRSL